MKLAGKILILFIAFSMGYVAYGDNKGKKEIYAFGFSASFTDSVVYFTDMQVLDSIKLDSKGFLPERAQYSYQLKNYLEWDNGLKNRTCVIYFSPSQKKLQKEERKLHERYMKDKNVIVKQIPITEFRFTKPAE